MSVACHNQPVTRYNEHYYARSLSFVMPCVLYCFIFPMFCHWTFSPLHLAVMSDTMSLLRYFRGCPPTEPNPHLNQMVTQLLLWKPLDILIDIQPAMHTSEHCSSSTVWSVYIRKYVHKINVRQSFICERLVSTVTCPRANWFTEYDI